MSFVRVNRRPLRTKKVSVTKKEWVSTVNDLSVHKATPEDLSKRHETHRSRNRVLAQWELREKALKRAQRKPQPASPTGLDQTRLRIIKEVFSDRCQLQDVLARSDRAMAVVKDLFGDAPRRQTGFPSVTMVPDCGSDTELPVLQKPDPPTQLSLLSQTMMDQQVLLKRKTCKPKLPVWRADQQQNLAQITSNVGGPGDQAALNATVAVQRLKTRQAHPDLSQSSTLVNQVLNPDAGPSQSGREKLTQRGYSARLDSSGLSSRSTNLSSLELLQDKLGQVETELHFLEQKGPLGSPEQPELHQGRGLTGFSVALVAALSRIARHLRRREEEVQKEALERQRLEEEVREQKSLINALTAECFSLREESAATQVNLPRVWYGHAGADLKLVSAERALQEQASASPAVLLSPPHQRDSRVPAAGESCPRSLHFESSNAAANLGSTEESDVSCTPPSFVSLPVNVSPRRTLPADQLSHDAMLGQIAELTHQNAAIRVQLDQSRFTPAGAPASSEESADRLSAVTTLDGQASPPTAPQPTQQSSVRLMEERLQELNRQSTAARAKLLELIEQQRQSAYVSASPSVSPVPPHSTSPTTGCCVCVFLTVSSSSTKCRWRRKADTGTWY
uniref:Spindle and centriole-associated protein 1 n=1 Tax=Electrophorus electricus TaxID=8005 RepID=A0A4W4HDW2_ELEEL